MRYRQLDANGDYTLGGGLAAFYVNSPLAVAQAVRTRLALWSGEWFLDTTDGTNWQMGVLGRNTQSTRDAVIQNRVLSTPGVNVILSYSSSLDRATRSFNVSMTLDTIYGPVPVSDVVLPLVGIGNVTASLVASNAVEVLKPISPIVAVPNPPPVKSPATDFAIGVGRIGVDFVG